VLAQPGRSPEQIIELAWAAAAGGASPSGMRWRGCYDRADPCHHGRAAYLDLLKKAPGASFGALD
jgi:hypothetical protein